MQWLISFGLGLTVIPIDFLIKFVPDRYCFEVTGKIDFLVGKEKEEPI
jgi:hypothetical protein